MLNPIGHYESAGNAAGFASKHHDAAGARFHSEWARRAIALEKPEDRQVARSAFDSAYRAAATPSFVG